MLSLDFWSIFWTVVNLLIFYLLMKKFLFKPVLGIMQKREDQIQDQLLGARKTEEKASDFKKEYEEKLLAAQGEASVIREEAKERAQSERVRILEETQEEASGILKKAKADIRVEQERAKRSAETEIAELAIQAAKKILGSSTSDAGNQVLYNQFLTKAGEMDDANRN